MSLKLTKSEVGQLYKLYRKVDIDDSGTIDTVELLTMLDIERTRFTEQVLNVFDGDKSGKIDFREFVLSIWNYCTTGNAALGIFTFDLYDQDGSGILSIDEMVQMLKDIYGNGYKGNNQAKHVESEMRKLNKQKGVNIEAFKEFSKTHQNLLFPVFKLQLQMQTAVLGTRFWERASERRVQLSKGKYVTISELMQIHVNQNLYEKVLDDSAKVKKMNPKALAVIQSTGTTHGRQVTDKENNVSVQKQQQGKGVYAPPPPDDSTGGDAPSSGINTQTQQKPPHHRKKGAEGRRRKGGGNVAVADAEEDMDYELN